VAAEATRKRPGSARTSIGAKTVSLNCVSFPAGARLRYSSECHYIAETGMDKAISAADANRRFSELLRTVKKGRSVIVTSHGRPVAKITPVAEDERNAQGARSALFARLRTQRVANAGRWTRDELYNDAP